MNRKSTLKDFARWLMETQPIVIPGPGVMVELQNASTGEIRFERVRQDWWEDENFRFGYEAVREEEGWLFSRSSPFSYSLKLPVE